MSTIRQGVCSQNMSSLLGALVDSEDSSLAYCLACLLLSCQEIDGMSDSIREHLSQKMVTITHDQVQLITTAQQSPPSPVPEDRVIFPLRWENVSYGFLAVQPFSDYLSFAQILATICAWLLRTLEDAAFVHRRRPHLTKEHLQGLTELTQREFEVLKLMVKGDSINAIADLLSLSKRTVEKHQRHIYERLCVSSSQDAVLIGLVGGLA